MPERIPDLYQSRVAAGALRPDPAQAEAARLLQDLALQLDGYSPDAVKGLRALFKKKSPAPRGIYLYGDVGRGKSLLMDLFFAEARVNRKRRVHFHQFMLEIHDRLHRARASGDALPQLARALAQEAWLLCFDEFHVGNIADAMILGRLFTALFEAGVVVVLTSNAAPVELYRGGLQRERFLPFIELIKRHMDVHHLAGAVDYRYAHLRRLQSCFTPLGPEATQRLEAVFADITGGVKPESLSLPVEGRSVAVPRTARGVAWFGFAELCSQPLGAADYLALAACFHTLMIDGVPVFTAEQRNETARFMTLIDALYEAKTQLFWSAAAPPERLCVEGELAQAFQRTASRLVEMQSEAYRQLPHGGV